MALVVRGLELDCMDEPSAAIVLTPCINLARLDLVSIRLVVLCDECGSLSIAARRANMSKSRASHRLTSLEVKLGTQLFARDHRGVHPTKAGLAVAAHGRSILREIDQLGHRLVLIDRTASISLARP